MTSSKHRLLLAPGLLIGLFGCSGEEGGPDDGGGGADATVADVDAGSVEPDAAPHDAGFSEECEKQPNLTRIDEMSAAQPSFETRHRQIIRVTISFASLADDPSQTCSVDLDFKDSNGNGTLEPYENWWLSAEERATDLVGRMSSAQKVGLMVHPTLADDPASSVEVSSTLATRVTSEHVRFGLTDANLAPLIARATWANNLQALAEGADLGVPFVLSMTPSHATGNGRSRAVGFSQWPHELGLAATDDLTRIEGFGQVVSQEYRAIGVRMALSPSADLATEPRWFDSQFTFGEEGARVSQMVAAYVRGLQGQALGPQSVAAVVSHFPGAGAAKGGWHARLAKGKFTAYPGDNIDEHLSAFEGAFEVGVQGVMPGYAIPEQGAWTGLDGLLDGSTIEQVGASFNGALLGDALRGHYAYEGLVLAPWGVLEDAGLEPFGAPWGVEALSRVERVVKAVNAGVDQLGGLSTSSAIAEAVQAGSISAERVDAAAARALAVIFRLGLFEDPYVDPEMAPALANNDENYRAGLRAMNRSLVLLHNADKPEGWLNGDGDGTQTGDKGNAGNGTLKVLPAPPGEPYVSAGCAYFVAGNIDLDYVRSVSNGYGLLTNDVNNLRDIPVSTPAERMALSDYIFIRIDAPFTPDPEAGTWGYPLASLEYEDAANAAMLAYVDEAVDAIEDWNGSISSQAQIVVLVDSGRPSVVEALLERPISALYLGWIGKMPDNKFADKVMLDVAFGIVDGAGVLPVGLPLSDEAASGQLEDVAGDGQHTTFQCGHGLPTPSFE